MTRSSPESPQGPTNGQGYDKGGFLWLSIQVTSTEPLFVGFLGTEEEIPFLPIVKPLVVLSLRGHSCVTLEWVKHPGGSLYLLSF